MSKIYDLLEPKKYTRLELNQFDGVVLNKDECIAIISRIFNMERALNDIKNWDEDMYEKWEDQGYRAIDGLKNLIAP